MQVLSLFDLNEFLRRVVALNFPQAIWITAEIGQIGLSKGHWYLHLLQKSEAENSEIIATSSAILWSRNHQQLSRQLGKAFQEVLQEGRQIKAKVEVVFHERYGLQLQVVDIDPTYTFGQAALQRAKTIESLQKSGLLKKNAQLSLPAVIQKIAVVSSENAAGWQDFRQHLQQNNAGYQFDLQLFAAAMQGSNATIEVPHALRKIANLSAQFDAVVIIRGGGARLDLAAFDELEICKAVAQMPLPVLVGIGHERDETVLDLAAKLSLKTPTAVADFLLEHNAMYENEIRELGAAVQQIATNRLKISSLEILNLENSLRWAASERIRRADFQLDFFEKNLPERLGNFFKSHFQKLENYEQLVASSDPQTLLRRGFSITKLDGKIVRSKTDLEDKTGVVTIVFADGEVNTAWGK